MEGLPRAPQSGDRRVANRENRQEPAYRASDEPRQSPEAHAPHSYRNDTSYRSEPGKSSKKGLIWAIVAALIVIVLIAAAWFVFGSQKNQPTGIDNGRYQAVFLANGQIYFGKLENFSDSSFKMTKIYYPQSTAEDAASTNTNTQSQNSNIQLIRLGDEVHGPDNEMFLIKDQILYYENLKSDSKVSQLINQNEQSQK